MKRAIFFLFTLMLILAGCSKSVSEEFLKSDDVRLEIDNKAILVYEPLTCQYVYNVAKKQFRLGNDSMSEYYVLTLSSPINGKMKEIGGTLQWNASKVSGSGSYTFKIEKFDDDGRWWLSCKKKKIAVSFIIPK